MRRGEPHQVCREVFRRLHDISGRHVGPELDGPPAVHLEEVGHGLLIGQIQFGVGTGHETGVAFGFEVADNGAADQSAMSGDVDFRLFVHPAYS